MVQKKVLIGWPIFRDRVADLFGRKNRPFSFPGMIGRPIFYCAGMIGGPIF
jgi:hypothetical protein